MYGSCVSHCDTEATDWCANAFHNEHYSCNTTNGHCWERPCDIALNDCPTDYVCKEEYGWAHCMIGCVNDTKCAQDNNYDESFKCQGNGLCERDTCADPVDCTESGYTCTQFNECVPGCQNNYDCEMNHGSPEWQCGVDSYCVYRECLNDTICINNRGTYYTCNKTNDDYWQCTRPYCNDDNDCEVGQLCDNYMGDNYCRAGCSNDTDCYNIFYGMKPMCDTATGTCHEENCVNTPSLCSGNGPGSYCNATTGYCEDDWCYDDSECTHPTNTICNNNWMRCVPPCDPFVPLLPKWCATEFNNEYSSCNMSNGQCWEKGCTDDTDCPSAYVCKDRGGWSTCAVDCASNDTYCAETNNGDTSFKCQVNGVCEQYSCTDHSECGSGSRCNAFGNCVSGCQNNTVCASSHGWDWNWKCGDNNYCVYRACYNDTDCPHMGSPGACNTTSDDHWHCEWSSGQNDCYGDWECDGDDICESMACTARCYQDYDCDMMYGDGRPICNMTSGRCESRNCANTPNYCEMYGAHPVGAICDSGECVYENCTTNNDCMNFPACHDGICGPNCNGDSTWCEQTFGIGFECFPDETCGKQSCATTAECSSSKVCLFGNCEEDCGNHITLDPYFCQYQSYLDHTGDLKFGDSVICNQTTGACEFEWCVDSTECSVGFICDIDMWMNCIRDCNSMNDTFCEERMGYGYYCSSDGICDEFTYTTPDPTDTTSQYTTQPPDTTGLDTTEPVTTEPDTTTGLDTTEPDTTEPDTTEPETTELETTELETTELETTELETTEEPETYCSADVNDDFCFELAGAQTCHRTASDFDTFKGQSPHSGQRDNKMCELCARYGSDQTGDLCQCLLLLKNNVIPDLGRAREKVKQIIVDECWQTADGPCSSFDNIVAQTEGCGCGALSCDDSVGGLTESGGGDSNKAYKYSIDVAVWIAFFMYVVQ
eukprot:343881_1